MKGVNGFILASSLLSFLAVPAMAQVMVNSPVNDAQVASPVSLAATAGTCSTQNVTSMGYTIDSVPSETVVTGASIGAAIAMAPGPHVIHVLAYGQAEATCDTDIAVTVTPTETGPTIPTSAVTVSNIQILGKWKSQHDTGGQGSSQGTTTIVSAPSMTGNARKFVTSYEHNGDERYSVTFADDAQAQNFLYDAWVYFDKSSGSVGNLEMDLNQVMSNGQNTIFAFQCAGDSNTWDYTTNAGTPKKYKVKWLRSTQACNPRAWSINTWHHVQITYRRDEVGTVTYQSVWLDGVEQDLNVTVPSAFALGWPAGSVQTQFQVDGVGKSGKTTVYLDHLTISRW